MCVTPLRAGSTLLVLLQTAVKPAAAQSQSLGRLADVSLEPRQRFLDQVALDFFEAHFFQPGGCARIGRAQAQVRDRKSTRLNSSHSQISYAVFCLKKKTKK